MCGTIGYLGREDALPILRDGLSNLEYCGYDSAEIALGGQRLDVYKKGGELSALKAILPESSTATTRIGHTRWSTHGKPTDRNAHPHTDESGDVAVVHNGVIENYDALRAGLKGRVHEFTSDTDTEIVSHLVREELASDRDAQRKPVRPRIRRPRDVPRERSARVRQAHAPGELSRGGRRHSAH
ncbi:hypothetical protein [Halobellus inordinatus]|uniref:hypothetical protein n=1 Tax=Halobellus inordinatus TaxID=1126236 RepID=UPI0031B82FA1